jgi:hypothetical protein
VGTNASATASVDCPVGWQALGGGADFQTQSTTAIDIVFDGPLVAGDKLIAASEGNNPASTGWKVRVQNNDLVSSYTSLSG